MDQTAIQAGTGITAPKSTALQTGPPPVGVNGSAAATEPKPKPYKHPARRALEMAADLRVTVFLFALSILIVFWGTLAQVDNGVWTVVAKYFRSAFVLIPLKVILFNAVEAKSIVVPFPGGWLIGGAMLVNLLAAHAIRFKLTWSRAGIILIHSGIIVIMLGELVTGLFAIEGQVHMKIGEKTQIVTEPGTAEFVLIRTLDTKQDEVTSVPKARLVAGTVIDDPQLPFKLEITRYMVNSEIVPIKGQPDPDAVGHARIYEAIELPEANGVNDNQRHDVPTMLAKLTDREGKSLGTWLFSAHLENQWITVGKNPPVQLALRFKQTKRDYTLHLTDFKHDVFPGTQTPKDFHSYIRLTDEANNVDRPVEIYMNAPLYYQGETFYQSSWTTDPFTKKANGTVLQVVRNPGWLMPYLACLLVGVGMLVHFGLTLYKFLDRRIVR